MSSSDLPSLLPKVPPQNRRQFLVTKLAAGFALAVSPVGAETITTDTKGLTAGDVMIPVQDGAIPGYAARPERGGNMPAVVVVHEIFGVHEHIKDICRRLAKAGYSAVAPALFAREGDVSKIENIPDIITEVVSKVPDEQVMIDIDATINWAVIRNRADRNRVAITGFCWGGRIVWLYCAEKDTVKCGAAWYGRLEGEKNAMTPFNPIDYAGGLREPVIGFYGGQDAGIPDTSIANMRTALSIVGDPSKIIVYPEAGHGFNADYRPSYNEAAAKDAWKQMLDWFKENGV